MPKLIAKSLEGYEISPFYYLRLGTNRIGRDSANHLRIEHPTISSSHCEITWLDEGVVKIKDCGSTNGTFIDGTPINEGKLKEGQVLRLGDVELTLDSVEAQISVPKTNVPKPKPGLLADGSIPCISDHNVAAVYLCKKCKKEFCTGCIHQLHRVGGKLLRLCPECSGELEYLPGKEPRKPKKRSLLGRVKDALTPKKRKKTEKV